MLALIAVSSAAMATVPNFGPGFNASKDDNMNGEYVFSKTPGAGNMEDLFPKRFADYPWVTEKRWFLPALPKKKEGWSPNNPKPAGMTS